MSSYSSSLLSLLLVSGLAASTVACTAASTTDDPASADSDITGVTDLTEVESALGLTKDIKRPDGTWYRGDERLKGGSCYQQLIAGPDGASYQFRRYMNGASFFKKLGAGAESGDERPVVCIDVDVTTWNNGEESTETYSLHEFEVDAVLRYRLGAPQGSEGAAGNSYETYVGGVVRYLNWACSDGGVGFSFDPKSEAEIARHCLIGMEFPGSGGEVDGGALLTVYQFARKKAAPHNRFSSEADAVGRFIKVRGDVIEYEKVDLHIVSDGDAIKYQLTSHGAPATAWFYECVVRSEEDTSTTLCGGN